MPVLPSELSIDDISAALYESCGVVDVAARSLGVNRNSMYAHIRRVPKLRAIIDQWKGTDEYLAAMAEIRKRRREEVSARSVGERCEDCHILLKFDPPPDGQTYCLACCIRLGIVK